MLDGSVVKVVLLMLEAVPEDPVTVTATLLKVPAPTNKVLKEKVLVRAQLLHQCNLLRVTSLAAVKVDKLTEETVVSRLRSIVIMISESC